MTLLYYDEDFLLHKTGNHPESPVRLATAFDRLIEQHRVDHCERPHWDPVSLKTLQNVHDSQYIERIKQTALLGGGQVEADTVMCDRSYDVALKAVGAVCDAVRRVADGEDRKAFCMVRPPGHHALGDDAMGFCLFNNIAVGARVATRELEYNRVLIVDFDVHHGNGTQASFWTDPQVGFFSAHRYPFYPGSGSKIETGEGAGLGTTRNLPVEFGTAADDYVDRFRQSLDPFAEQIKPEMILVSAGFDAHALDPIGSLGLREEHFEQVITFLIELADTHCDGKLVSVLEGGYNPEQLANCCDLYLSRLISASD